MIISLETTPANRFLGTDRGPKHRRFDPNPGSSSVSDGCKNRAGQFVCTGRAGKVIRWDKNAGRDEGGKVRSGGLWNE